MTQTIISHEQLRKIAGQTRFDQGLKNSQHFSITDFHYHNKQASAKVEQFNVRLHYLADTIEGNCTCPDSDGFDFCEHCVALTLYANKLAQQISSLSKGPDKSKVLAFLLQQDKASLAKQCLELIENDPEQFKRFILKASLNSEKIDYSQLKTQITTLTRKQDNMFSQRQVKSFFSRIELFLEELILSDYLNAPEKMIKLIEYAFHRMNQLLEEIDDSNLQHQPCIEKLQALYADLIAAISGKPDTKVKRLYQLWLKDSHNLLGSDMARYLIQPGSQTKFNELILKSWKDIQSTSSNSQTLNTWQQEKTARYLLEHSTQQGKTDSAKVYRDFLTGQ